VSTVGPDFSAVNTAQLKTTEVRVVAEEQPVVLVLDDDPGIRAALAQLLTASGMRVVLFASAEELMSGVIPDAPCCLLLDLQLPDITGLEIQEKLAARDGPPIIFISGHGDIPTSIRAIKGGAVEFLPKPFSDEELFDAIRVALARDRRLKQTRAERTSLQKLYAQLTARERQALPLIASGLTNKQSADKLGIAEITLQIHRRQILKKMGAQSIPDLVRLASKLGIL
jgi:FixJ family two-component response regulator